MHGLRESYIGVSDDEPLYDSVASEEELMQSEQQHMLVEQNREIVRQRHQDAVALFSFDAFHSCLIISIQMTTIAIINFIIDSVDDESGDLLQGGCFLTCCWWSISGEYRIGRSLFGHQGAAVSIQQPDAAAAEEQQHDAGSDRCAAEHGADADAGEQPPEDEQCGQQQPRFSGSLERLRTAVSGASFAAAAAAASAAL